MCTSSHACFRCAGHGGLAGESPIWRPGELGGPGGRLQTISMVPQGRFLQMATPSKRARLLAPELTPSQAADVYTGTA